jgi:hypothetical protein
MRPPDELNGDEIAARRLFARLDASLRAAAKGRWLTAKRTRNAALVNRDLSMVELKEIVGRNGPTTPTASRY